MRIPVGSARRGDEERWNGRFAEMLQGPFSLPPGFVLAQGPQEFWNCFWPQAFAERGDDSGQNAIARQTQKEIEDSFLPGVGECAGHRADNFVLAELFDRVAHFMGRAEKVDQNLSRVKSCQRLGGSQARMGKA